MNTQDTGEERRDTKGEEMKEEDEGNTAEAEEDGRETIETRVMDVKEDSFRADGEEKGSHRFTKPACKTRITDTMN